MSLADLFHIEQIQADELSIQASVAINPIHQVFQGHFPNQPILPGVLQIEILKAIMTRAWEVKPRLTRASTIKYLKMVDPNETPILRFSISKKVKEDHFAVSAESMISEEEVCFKFKGEFVRS